MFHETWRMEKMFKKTLIAAALATSAFGANAAISVTTSSAAADKAYDISAQGLPLTKATELADVILTLSTSEASALSTGAKIKLTFSGAFVQTAPAAVPAYADVTPASGTAADNTFAGDKDTDGTANGTVGNFTGSAYVATSTTLTVPFNAVPVDGDNDDTAVLSGLINGDTITISNIKLLLASADVGSTVTVTAELVASTGASVSGTSSPATKVIDVVNQFAAKVKATSGAADALIDVANSRLTFESKVKTDTIILDTDTVGTGATATSAKVTIKGDFTDDITKLSDGTNTYAVNTAGTEATYTYAAGTTPSVATFLNQDTTLTATVDGVDVIAPRKFTASVDLAYTDAESSARTQSLLTDGAAGEWKLNGDNSAHVAFMPFGPAFSQSVTVQNNGAVDGEISIDWYTSAGKVTTVLTGTAKPYVVTDISSELRTVAAANGITGNIAFDVVVNSPATQINVTAVYYSKTDGDRVLVLGESVK